MTKAPTTGEYIIGDLETDGHTHKFVVGEHFMDQEYPNREDPDLVSGDYPRATTSDAVNTQGNHIHAHSVTASNTQDETLIVGPGGPDSNPHTHTTITKVEE